MAALSLTTDSFSPILIKELRQGLKSKAFYFAFLLMQGLMFFSVLILATTMESRGNPEGANVTFWVCLGGPLIFITPLRALGALQQEIKGNTLELIFLTRLSAWRIVAGKWFALFSQSLLLTVAALPYVFLRYFMGGVNISEDLVTMFWMLVASAALTALGVCFSAFRAPWVRVVVIIAAFLAPYFLLVMFFAMRFGGGSIYRGIAHPFAAALILNAAIATATVLMLFWGASRIAPAAENYSRWKRLLTLVLLALVPAVSWSFGEKESVLIALVVIIPLCLDALGERPLFFPSVYMPFERRGVLGRLAGTLFQPGWPSAVFFTLLCCAAFVLMVYLMWTSAPSGVMGMVAALPGALLFPLALVLVIKPKAENILGGIIGIIVASVIIAIVAIAVHESYPRLDISFLHLIPTCSFVLHVGEQGGDGWIYASLVITAMTLVLLFARMRPVAIEIRRQKRLARELLAARTTETTP